MDSQSCGQISAPWRRLTPPKTTGVYALAPGSQQSVFKYLVFLGHCKRDTKQEVMTPFQKWKSYPESWNDLSRATQQNWHLLTSTVVTCDLSPTACVPAPLFSRGAEEWPRTATCLSVWNSSGSGRAGNGSPEERAHRGQVDQAGKPQSTFQAMQTRTLSPGWEPTCSESQLTRSTA